MSRRSKKRAESPKSPIAPSNASETLTIETLRAAGSRRPPTGGSERWAVLGVCIFLAVIIWLVFGQTLRFGFVNYDDPAYVYDNPIVQQGLTWKGFCWALTYGAIGHWHPLTWLSHMLDCQLYGLNAGGPHLTNVLLHMAAAILLFLVLRRMTGFLWRSAFVAAVFAIHPLRAESVAWIAERKDVLSGLFFMLTLAAYVHYVRHPPSMRRYGLVVLCFALGLLAKDMLVTLPFVLLLLDYWPLKRMGNSEWGIRNFTRLLVEKLPLLVLTVGSCVVTFLVPEKLPAYEHLPLGLRLENAVVSYVTYLWQMIYPVGLACLYPNPTHSLPLWRVGGALALLVAISGVAWVFRQQRPWLAAGWLWYLGMLVPVIGIVQISYYAHADRYTYLPQIGLYIILVWGVADLCARWRYRQWVLGGLSVAILAALMVRAHTQVAYWRNSEALWIHTLACTSDNVGAHINLGNALLQEGKMDKAMFHFQKASQINPNDPEANNDLGNVLLQEGKVDEAIAHYQKALQINPHLGKTYYNLGAAMFQKGKVNEAIALYQRALQIDPDLAEAHNNLGNALLRQGKVNEAIAQFQRALQLKPDLAETHFNLGNALRQAGHMDEAMAQFQRALQIQPDYAEACYDLGNAFREKGRMDEAIAYYQKALQIKPRYAAACYDLGNAYREKGRPGEAIAYYRKALQIHPDYAEALNNLARLLATCPQASLRNGKRAMDLAQRANQLTGNSNLVVLGTLAAAYAEAGRFPEAVKTARRALHLAETQSNAAAVDAIRSQLKLYQAGLPLRSQ